MEIDQLIFQVALPEAARSRVVSAGQIKLEATEAAALAQTKHVHMWLVTCSILLSVVLRGALGVRECIFSFWPFLICAREGATIFMFGW